MLENFEIMSGGMTRGTPGAIKFLKTNPTRHKVLAYAKKAVDRAANDKYWMNKEVYDEFQDAVRILDESRKELGISRAFERALGHVEWALEGNDAKFLKRQAKSFQTQYKKEMAKPNMNYVKVDFKVVMDAEKWKIRKTKNVNGKRVKRTETELKKLIENKKKSAFERDRVAEQRHAAKKARAEAAAKKKAEAAAKKAAREKKKANAAAKKATKATKATKSNSKNALKNSNWNNTVWANQNKRNLNAFNAFKMPNAYINKSSNNAYDKNYRKMKAKRYNLYSNELQGLNQIYPPVSFKNNKGKWKSVNQLSKERNEKRVSNNAREKLENQQRNARMARMKKYVESLPKNHGFFKTNQKVAYNYMVRDLMRKPEYFSRFKDYVEKMK